MNKEYKRYYLTSYSGTRETTVQTNREYEEILKEINNYNKRKYNKRKKDENGKYKPRTKTKYLYGNVTREITKDGIHIVAHVYTKLSDASTISDLLELTSQYSKEELAESILDQTNMVEGYIPDINIAYFENKDKGAKEKIHYDRRIKYLPVLYKDDRKYLSMNYNYSCLKYHVNSRHFDIIRGLASELCFNKNSAEELEKVLVTLDKCEHQDYPLDELYNACVKLIDKYTYEINKDGSAQRDEKGNIITSMRRKFDVGMYFKYCTDLSKKHSPIMYNEGPNRKKKEELKKEEEERKVKELKLSGKYTYEQMSLF